MHIERVLCRVCLQRLATEGFLTCEECSARVVGALDDIVRIYPDVEWDAHHPPRSADQVRGRPVYKSTPPINLDQLDRAHRLAELDVLGCLAWWAGHVRDSTGLAPNATTTVAGEIGVLVRMWSWIRRQSAVDELARDVVVLRAALQRMAGETRGRIRLGRCPAR
ncbi:hypothetical protein BBK82_05070 [Lentzea guizhouensis]|uniref:Uncharacterized protein n=1 Tax=Lentzea guizhouensis TaxID=1586287 RepID=A0A1B2HCT2_9PSEU|nr:hypothetical protein [Lentzea guizhouensis]ANZ35544.1 hypothetical protein BBK82_05070 [Lentzea guizhouensis]